MGDNDGPFPWALIGFWALILVLAVVLGWGVWWAITEL